MQYRQQQPAVCLQGGVLRQICAGEGETVRKGQLLFALDTRQEEAALERLAAGRHAMEEAVSAFGQEAALWKLSERLEMESQEAALKQSIALKQIRAEQDGVMGAGVPAGGGASEGRRCAGSGAQHGKKRGGRVPQFCCFQNRNGGGSRDSGFCRAVRGSGQPDGHWRAGNGYIHRAERSAVGIRA